MQCDFHFKIMSYELKLLYFIQYSYKVTHDETWNVLRNRNDLVSLHVCLVNVQLSSDWISRLKLQSIPVLSLSVSLSVVMRGPGAACRWHDHEGLEEDCLEKDLSFSFSSILYIFAMISSLYLYQSLFVSFFCLLHLFFRVKGVLSPSRCGTIFSQVCAVTFGAQLPPCRPGRPWPRCCVRPWRS